MRRIVPFPLFVILSVAVVLAACAALGVAPVDFDGLATFGLAGAVAAPAVNRLGVPWGRKREPMKTWSNVPSGVPSTVTTVYNILPRYPRTVLTVMLELGGTTFTKALISRVEVFLGSKSIWGPVSGSDIDTVERYVDDAGREAFFLPVDFTYKNSREIGGEQIGGLDLTTLPEGEVRIEVDMAVGVSAPTLRSDIVWGPPQGGGIAGAMIRKLTKRTYPQAAAGDFFPDVNNGGAIVARHFFFSSVATAAVTAAQAEGVANTGDGAMGAVTVTAQTPVGRYKLRFIEPAANAGRFAVFGPDGVCIGTGTVAVAFSAGGLAFTLADGATDFVAGDGFTIDVLPFNTNQNINAVEVKKNEDVWWSMSDKAARHMQRRYGRQPLSQLYVVDFMLDNHIDALLDTANAVALDYKLNLTAADTVTVLTDQLALPV